MSARIYQIKHGSVKELIAKTPIKKETSSKFSTSSMFILASSTMAKCKTPSTSSSNYKQRKVNVMNLPLLHCKQNLLVAFFRACIETWGQGQTCQNKYRWELQYSSTRRKSTWKFHFRDTPRDLQCMFRFPKDGPRCFENHFYSIVAKNQLSNLEKLGVFALFLIWTNYALFESFDHKQALAQGARTLTKHISWKNNVCLQFGHLSHP